MESIGNHRALVCMTALEPSRAEKFLVSRVLKHGGCTVFMLGERLRCTIGLDAQIAVDKDGSRRLGKDRTESHE